jgi:hypothetical protein
MGSVDRNSRIREQNGQNMTKQQNSQEKKP